MSRRRKKIYLAAPLFSDCEKFYNQTICKTLERYNFDVFLPQRDGLLYTNLLAEGVGKKEATEMIFSADMKAVRSSDAIVAIMDGRTIDEGVAFEIGVGFSLKKFLLGIQTDARRLLPAGNNPMIEYSLDIKVNDLSSMLEAIRRWRQSSRLM